MSDIKKEQENEFMRLVIHDVHDLFDKANVWGIIEGEKSNKDLLRVFFNAAELVEKRRRNFVKDQGKKLSEGFYIDTSKAFFDAVYVYLVDSKDIEHFSKGGLFLSTLSALSVLTELSSTVCMYIDDDEGPYLNINDKLIKKILK